MVLQPTNQRIRVYARPSLTARQMKSLSQSSLSRLLLVVATAIVAAVTAENVDKPASMSCDNDNQNQANQQTANIKEPDHIIIGGGGSGIQTALLLEKYGLTYVILEKEDIPGSFWTKFPRFRELISINKWSREEKHRLRFDWHSFLEAPLEMLDVTEAYFPTGDDWQRYMAEVVRLADLNIEYGAEVKEIISSDGEKPCVIMANGSKRCAQRRIFVGTGLVEKKEPLLEAMGAIPYSQMTKAMARRKRVCIFGNGNAGFEVAQNTYDVADKVSIMGKRAHRIAAVTKYTGDVRLKFLQILENFHFKLRDTVDQADAYLQLSGLEHVLSEDDLDTADFTVHAGTIMERDSCEVSVIATGFRSQVPGMDLSSRFPDMGSWYESTALPRVHYIGWHMHAYDYQMSSAGFLHGYRYLIRNLVHHIRSEEYGVEYPHLTLSKEQVVNHVLHRLDTVSDLILLQEGVTLRDVIVPVGDEYLYYESVTYHFHDEIMKRNEENLIYLYFVWGDTRTATDVFDNVNRYTNTKSLRNAHIHPAIEVNGTIREMEEDIGVDWSGFFHVQAIETTIRAALDGDLSSFRPIANKPYQRAVVNMTEHELNSHERGVGDGGYDPIPTDFISAMVKSIMNGYASDDLQDLTKAAKRWLPSMFSI